MYTFDIRSLSAFKRSYRGIEERLAEVELARSQNNAARAQELYTQLCNEVGAEKVTAVQRGNFDIKLGGANLSN